MKYILAFLLLFGGTMYAQTTKTAKPNVTVEGNIFRAVETSGRGTAEKTDKVYIDRNKVEYPVYKTKNGKYFVMMTSKKTGNQYRKYLVLPN